MTLDRALGVGGSAKGGCGDRSPDGRCIVPDYRTVILSVLLLMRLDRGKVRQGAREARGTGKAADVLEFWRIWRARKAAVDVIRPLVERTRFVDGRIDERAWMDPYMIGFMATLITLVAQRRFRSIGQDALGNVQADAWQEISGLPGALVGQEICLLSSTRDPEFELGCRNAAAFVVALVAAHDVGTGDPGAAFIGSAGAGQFSVEQGDCDVWALWSDYFGRRPSA